MSDIAVRPVAATDLPVLAHIYGEAFEEPYPEPVANSLLMTPGAWGLLAVAGSPDGPIPAGFVIARVIVDELEILSIGTLRRARRHGVATALMAAAFARARAAGAAVAHLEVGEDNPGAIALYRGIGFRRVGRRPDYYRRADRSRVAALLMSMALKSEQ